MTTNRSTVPARKGAIPLRAVLRWGVWAALLGGITGYFLASRLL